MKAECMIEIALMSAADLKPENLLYLSTDPTSDLVLADFGIAKMLDSKDEVLTTMAGSFGYAAPEVMLKKGHGKPVDMWSLGVITYTLLCGYSPFRSENLQDLIDECSNARVVFHERYWKDVSDDAKDFIGHLLQPDAEDRSTSKVFFNPRFFNQVLIWNSKLYPTPGSAARTRQTITCCLRSKPTWQRPVCAVVSRL